MDCQSRKDEEDTVLLVVASSMWVGMSHHMEAESKSAERGFG